MYRLTSSLHLFVLLGVTRMHMMCALAFNY